MATNRAKGHPGSPRFGVSHPGMCWGPTAIAAGSVVEAVALDVLERALDADALRDRLNGPPQDQRRGPREARGPPSKWPFAFLLLALGPLGLDVLRGARPTSAGQTSGTAWPIVPGGRAPRDAGYQSHVRLFVRQWGASDGDPLSKGERDVLG